MASVRIRFAAVAAIGVLGVGGWLLHSALAAQAQGSALAQAPLNNQVQVPPAFIMAVDDSGSMTFQHQFPASDGYGCWHEASKSFFSSGALRTSGTSCRYAYSYSSPRNGWEYHGIPPIDSFGFSRSPDFNPSYFDPTIRYLPWSKSNGDDYDAADIAATRMHPENASPTIALASNLKRDSADSEFFAYRGMVLPEGTEFKRAEACTNAGSDFPSGNNWKTLSSDYTVPSDAYTSSNSTYRRGCRIYVKYWPATFFLRDDAVPQLEGTSIYASVPRVKVSNACGAGCDMWKYTIRAQDTEALQNFANWFSFYGNRNRAMIAGMTRSMATVNNMRVGYFKINSHGSYDEPRTKSGERVTMRDMAVATDRQALYSAMVGLTASGSTPNRQAVRAAGEQFRRIDDGAPVVRACQRNAAMLFTDGYSNQDGPSVGNVDGALAAPFRDGHENTMADIAAWYYLGDPLDTNHPSGKVRPPSGCPSSDPSVDCQTNLHVNFYGVTLGGRGALYDPDNVLDPYTTPSIYNNWPSRQNDNRSTIDDIWHATVNTRGAFINARTPADITEAMRRILVAVSSGASPSGTLALSGARISSRSLVAAPSYEILEEGTDWSGKLAASKPVVDATTREVTEIPLWEASQKLAAQGHAARREHAWYGTATGAAPLTGATLSMLCNNARPGMSRCTSNEITNRLGVTAAQAVDYLLGDTAREVRNGGSLRNRGTVLGDIINSTPVVSAPTDDYGYRPLGKINGVEYGKTYSTYVDTTKKSRPAMVYVGANDGMLHAFHGGIDAAGNVDSANGGKEQFAYVPRAVLGHMGNLLYPYVAADGGDQKFAHRYFVDGPITVSDAYYDGGWKTVLVGTAGAGGRSVFGLNVSNPGSFGSGNRLWEVDDQSTNTTVKNNIGHVLGRPVIVPVRTGSGAPSWKAIFGNGYDSENQQAALFVVDIATGTTRVIHAIEAAAPDGKNGLGNIVVTDQKLPNGDNGRDGFADTVYAADQKGAIWKFDLASDDTLTQPLFTTQTHTEGGKTYRQPILGGISATAGVGNGVMLFFGTGSFSFVDDPSDESIQSIYAVNDRGQTSTMTAGNLFKREIENPEATDARTVTTAGAVGQNGWYLDLPAGERAVGYPRVASGVLFIPTYAPSVADGCSTSGFNWLYGLNTRTGGPALESVRFGTITGPTQGTGVGAVSLDTGGTAPVKDVGLSVLSRPSPPNPGEPAPPDDGCWMRVTVSGLDEAMFLPYPCGRQSWRQLQ